jgi:hypothetical protein
MKCSKALKTGISLLLITLLLSACSKSADTDAPTAPVNAYDGLYRLRGSFTHPANPGGFDPILSNDIELRTTGQYTNAMYWRLADTFAHPVVQNGQQILFANQAAVYDFNPATNAVNAVTNYYPAGVVYSLIAGYNHRYDPVTKTIYAQYGYSGRIFTDTLTYIGPR